jgi:hypothetical protein
MKIEETVNEHYEKTLKNCEALKGKVKAYIIFVVTDEDGENGKKGVNAMEGRTLELMNLIANMDKDIINASLALQKFQNKD